MCIRDRVSFTGEKESYYWFLAKELKRLHTAVRERKLQIKEQDKKYYDRLHKVQEPEWAVGDRVLLKDVRIKPHSNRVITHRPFHGPLVIKEVVQNRPDIGMAYKLERLDGGRPLRFLVTADRLKKFTDDRTALLQRLPPIENTTIPNKDEIRQNVENQ